MEKKSWSVYERRRDRVKKKARELSSLCNVEVCMLCFGPTGDFTSWPEDPSKVVSIIERYNKSVIVSRSANKRNRIEKLSLSDVLDSKIKALQKQLVVGCETPEQRLDLLSKESLEGLAGCLESKLRVIERRIGVLKSEEIDWFPQPIQQVAPFTFPSQNEDPEFFAVLQSLMSHH